MFKKLLFLIYLFLLSLNLNAQCTGDETKVLVIGDSWAVFSWDFDAYNFNFDKYGFPNNKAYSSGSITSINGDNQLSQSGKKANNYLTNTRKSIISSAFANYPEIKIVHISLGGNDLFYGGWDTTYTDSLTNLILDRTLDSISSIIVFLRSINPNIQVLISGYDYPNFEEAINDFFIPSQHPFYGTWDGMLKPNYRQLAKLLKIITLRFQNYADSDSLIHFVDNRGLMQYVFGQTYNLPFPPGGTYPPKSVVLPGGDTNYPSPLLSMNYYQFAYDAFHLSPDGFKHFIGNHTKKFYFNYFRNYDITVQADSINSGSINSMSSYSNIEVGKINNEERAVIISFQLPNFDQSKEINNLSLFIKRKSINNGLPIHTFPLNLEIKNGYFGNSISLESTDLNSPSDLSIYPCIYGSLAENDFWLRIDIPSIYLQNLTPNQLIQFRLKLDNMTTNESIEFYNETNSDNTPFLDIKYGNDKTSKVLEQSNINSDSYVDLFPNPVIFDSKLTFKNPFTGLIQVFNTSGQKVYETNVMEQKNIVLNLDFLKSGIYTICFLSTRRKSDFIFNQTFVKK